MTCQVSSQIHMGELEARSAEGINAQTAAGRFIGSTFDRPVYKHKGYSVPASSRDEPPWVWRSTGSGAIERVPCDFRSDRVRTFQRTHLRIISNGNYNNNNNNTQNKRRSKLRTTTSPALHTITTV
jgi:hypothetical protein